ncbi:acyl-CoA dehydrogenase family protein [Nocardia sp. NPDC051052]|uniref:acyl-CoA dehydrogenase family protein n=1 Tax=Nocardia sp. NPDC051052 TaxID=3364322 RepID=UPI0037B4FB94
MQGTASAETTAFRSRVRKLVATHLTPLVPEAEQTRIFPREGIAAMGAEGLFRERWTGGPYGDLGRSVVISEELGRAGLGGVGAGVSLHFEAATAILRRCARTPYAIEVRENALDGRYVCCLATTEQHVGSNLAEVGSTTLTRDGSGWRVRGIKWFVSPGAAADVVLVLCRAEDGLAIAMVPQEDITVVKRLETTGMRGLGTARLDIDAHVSDEAIIAGPGLGLPMVTFGLLFERLAIAAGAVGSLELALTLASTHLRRRKQHGVALFEHQALRLRMADLVSQTALARHALYGVIAGLSAGSSSLGDLAGVKVTIARMAEPIVSECMHIFGGRGYLEDETPMARLWRDLRVGRVGAGTDEVMWELVASEMPVDDDLYDTWIPEEPS